MARVDPAPPHHPKCADPGLGPASLRCAVGHELNRRRDRGPHAEPRHTSDRRPRSAAPTMRTLHDEAPPRDASSPIQAAIRRKALHHRTSLRPLFRVSRMLLRRTPSRRMSRASCASSGCATARRSSSRPMSRALSSRGFRPTDPLATAIATKMHRRLLRPHDPQNHGRSAVGAADGRWRIHHRRCGVQHHGVCAEDPTLQMLTVYLLAHFQAGSAGTFEMLVCAVGQAAMPLEESAGDRGGRDTTAGLGAALRCRAHRRSTVPRGAGAVPRRWQRGCPVRRRRGCRRP